MTLARNAPRPQRQSHRGCAALWPAPATWSRLRSRCWSPRLPKASRTRCARCGCRARAWGGTRGYAPRRAGRSRQGECSSRRRLPTTRVWASGIAFCGNPVSRFFGGAFTVRFVTFSVVMGDGTDLNPGPAAVPKLSCAPASPLPSGPPSAYHRAANLKPMPCSGSLSLAASSRLPSRLRSRLCPSVQRTPPRQVRAPPSPSERPA